MKRIFLLVFIAFSATTLIAQQNFQPISIGSPIPKAAIKMKSVNGKQFSIQDVIDKSGTLVMFSCNTCPYVGKYQSRTLAAIKEAKENGFGVIIINSNEDARDDGESYTAMQEYAKSQQYNDVPYVVDENSIVANAFGATRTPETFLFNAKGQLIYHGAIDDNQDVEQVKRKHLVTAISEAINGKEVSVSNTRSVGCGIRRKA